MQTDILLINLGTPDQPTLPAVRRYLREFLADPRVIDSHPITRWLLVHGIFVPFRAHQTTHAYQQIWGDNGKSPLLHHSQALQKTLSQQMGDAFRVHLAMRYGNPSITKIIQEIKKNFCQKIIIVPLYPQYSSSASGTAIAKALSELQKFNNIPHTTVIKDFHDHPNFIESYGKFLKTELHDFAFDKLLFSFHGLPERHINKTGCSLKHCDRKKSCPTLSVENQSCYRGQSYATARLLAQQLQLQPEQYQIAFQSRLGKLPWITPYTDLLLPELIQQGVRRLAIACPSFICDCLETLEEIGIRAKQQWQSLGGEDFRLLPCLNADVGWVAGLQEIIRQTLTQP